MSAPSQNPLRMAKRHRPRVRQQPTAADGERLLRAQSVTYAIVAAIIAVVVFSILWAMLSTLAGRIFPWMTMLLGLLVGIVVRRAGRGLDWRFPLIAGSIALLGSFASNVVVAAAFTAPILETSTLNVLRAVTAMTWPVFFAEVMTPADLVFALFSAGIAATFANYRPNRAEFLALRLWEERHEAED